MGTGARIVTRVRRRRMRSGRHIRRRVALTVTTVRQRDAYIGILGRQRELYNMPIMRENNFLQRWVDFSLRAV
jgi:hypothetical protein